MEKQLEVSILEKFDQANIGKHWSALQESGFFAASSLPGLQQVSQSPCLTPGPRTMG